MHRYMYILYTYRDMIVCKWKVFVFSNYLKQLFTFTLTYSSKIVATTQLPLATQCTCLHHTYMHTNSYNYTLEHFVCSNSIKNWTGPGLLGNATNANVQRLYEPTILCFEYVSYYVTSIRSSILIPVFTSPLNTCIVQFS